MRSVQTTARLSIGDVARAAGLSVPAVRYYEQCGLLERPTRTPGGLRRYPADVLARLQFVGQAKALGLSLAEIRQLLALKTTRSQSCGAVLATLDRRLSRLDQQIAVLTATRDALSRHRAACARAIDSGPAASCPTLSALDRPCSLKSTSGR